jgi:hypothetical protein
MLKGRRKPVLALGALALMCSLAGAGVAVAAAGPPTIVAPHTGGHVNAGSIRLVVRAPEGPVFAQIRPQRKLNGAGHLAQCLSVKKRCDFVELSPWKGHPGEYAYTAASASFPGYWATTPGKLYWQAHYVDCFQTSVDGCHIVTRIGSFAVK